VTARRRHTLPPGCGCVTRRPITRKPGRGAVSRPMPPRHAVVRSAAPSPHTRQHASWPPSHDPEPQHTTTGHASLVAARAVDVKQPSGPSHHRRGRSRSSALLDQTTSHRGSQLVWCVSGRGSSCDSAAGANIAACGLASVSLRARSCVRAAAVSQRVWRGEGALVVASCAVVRGGLPRRYGLAGGVWR